MDWVWTWGGTSFGYRDGTDLWTHDGRHIGEFVGSEVYHPSGRYLGELHDGKLVTRRSKKNSTRSSFTPSMSRIGRINRIDRIGRIMVIGCENFPRPDQL
jgi:sporulation protein YlmC with PRC-barrel domain